MALTALALAACGQTRIPNTQFVTVNLSLAGLNQAAQTQPLAVPTLPDGTSAVKAVKVLVTDASGGPIKFDVNNAVSDSGSVQYLTLTPSTVLTAKFRAGVTYHFKSAGFDTASVVDGSRHLMAFNADTPANFNAPQNSLKLALTSVLGGASLTTSSFAPVTPSQTVDFVLTVAPNGNSSAYVPQADYSVAYAISNGTDTSVQPSKRGVTTQVDSDPSADLTVTATVSGLVVDPADRDNAIAGQVAVTKSILTTGLSAAGITADLVPPAVSALASSASGSTLTVSGVVSDDVKVASAALYKGSVKVTTLALGQDGAFSQDLSGVSATDQIAVVATDTASNEVVAPVNNAVAAVADRSNIYLDANYPGSDSNGSFAHPFTLLQAAHNAADPGATIRLAAGTYTDNLTITRPLTILGPNAGLEGKSGLRSAEAVITGVVALQGGSNNTTIDGVEVSQPTWPVAVANRLQITNGSNVTVKNSVFSGPGPNNVTWSASGVVRGLEVSGGLTGILITRNLFTGLRQPAYMNSSYVALTNNLAIGSRGWVLDGTLPDAAHGGITGNSFQSTEASDFALLQTADKTGSYCTTVSADSIRQANPGAIVDDQRTGCLN
ncbi:MAG TPA: hypothetical protein VHN99_09695 [Deinococcales bacterium]|nr:hypothetical protein [Deinococcales bacterium]